MRCLLTSVDCHAAERCVLVYLIITVLKRRQKKSKWKPKLSVFSSMAQTLPMNRLPVAPLPGGLHNAMHRSQHVAVGMLTSRSARTAQPMSSTSTIIPQKEPIESSLRGCERPKIEPFLGGATSALGIKFPSFHAEKRAVLAQGACSTELAVSYRSVLVAYG